VEGWSGYVVSGGTRCDYEPATGAFYRKVKTVAPAAGITGFTVVVDTQFLSGTTPPAWVAPRAGYNSQLVGKDYPASSQIGVTVTVFYDRRGTLRPVSNYSQIAERLVTTKRVRSEADIRVLDIGSVTKEGLPLSLSAGLLHLTGAVSYASTVKANLAATSAGIATGEQGTGAASTVSGPPSLTTVASPVSAGQLLTNGCAYACWGGTAVPGFSLSAENGLPVAGSVASPAQALLTNQTNSGITFGNSIPADYRADLLLATPTPVLVRLDPRLENLPLRSGLAGCGVGTTGAEAFLSATGYLRTTESGATGLVESCAVARATAIEFFPTTFAPHGVIRVELVRASANCLVQGAAHAATTAFDYRAVVKYFNGTDYVEAATVVPGQTESQLKPGLMIASVGGGKKLGDYVATWASVASDQVANVHSKGVAQVKVPPIVSITSQPVRAADEASVVSLSVGALSCSAEDAR
jgi:hypothetical protein